MTYENILIEKGGTNAIPAGITLLTINRPTKLNALNKATLTEIHHALNALETDKDTRVVVLTGSGDKSFVAGADIAEFAHYTTEQGAQMAIEAHELVFDKIQNFSKPVVAAVNGFALGGGLELAMACHFRVASENAKMGLPEVSLGIIPGYGGTQRLPQLVGKGRAMEMIMTAAMVSAQEALSYGLVNHVQPQAELLSFCYGIAQKIIRNSPVAIGLAIKAVNANFEDGVNGYQSEIKAFGKTFNTEDYKEGTTAFLEKRKPDFKGK